MKPSRSDIRYFHSSKLRHLIRAALREDAAHRDVTTRAVVRKGTRAHGTVVAKAPAVLAGLPVFTAVLREMDPRVRVRALRREGASVRRGAVVARVEGDARALLSAERTALNFLNHLSGIATATRKLSRVVGRRLTDTRKTTPLWRTLERYAVRVGGASNHRFDLSEAVLIKDNHLRLAGDPARAVAAARRARPNLVVEVEAGNLREALEAVEAGAHWVLLDNMGPRKAARILRRLAGRVKVELSGGLHGGNLGRFARLPVARFSSGALTHSAPAADFALEIFPARRAP